MNNRKESRRAGFIFLVVATAIVVLNVPSVADETDAVKDLLNRNEKGFQSGDVKVVSDTISDSYIGVMDFGEMPSGFVFDKDQLLDFVEGMASMDGEYRTVSKEISVGDGSAVVFATMSVESPEGEANEMKQMKIVCREKGQWKIMLDTGLFFGSKVVVTEVPAKTNASKIGLKKGDIVTFYANREVQSLSGLETAMKDHAGYPKGTTLVMNVLRGDKTKEFKVDPGVIEASFETRLVADRGGQIIGTAENHPAKETIKKMVDAFKAKDLDGLEKQMPEDGYLFVSEGEEGLEIVDPTNFRAEFGKKMEFVDQVADLGSLTVDSVRCLVKGNLALAEAKISMRLKDGNPNSVDGTYLLVRQEDRWLLAAQIPMKARIGTDSR